MADLTVSVVSADAELWTGLARQVIARTKIGQIGILAGHEPVLGVLASGEVRVTTLDGDVITVNAEDGFLSVQNDIVTVVAGAATIV
jgi:F-type H+-transporting ATPase subunit epsilon